jgi:hypothetical protein
MSVENDEYTDIQARWSKLLPWFAASGGSAQLPELMPFIASWHDFSTRWEDGKNLIGTSWFQPTDELGAAEHDISMAESNAIRRGYDPARGVTSPLASPLGKPATNPQVVNVLTKRSLSVEQQHPVAVAIDNTVKGSILDSPTDPRRKYPFGPVDPAKAPPDVLCAPCEKEYSTAWCKAINACPGKIGIGDVPSWVWALGGTAVASFLALAYVSAKATPIYVMMPQVTSPVQKS